MKIFIFCGLVLWGSLSFAQSRPVLRVMTSSYPPYEGENLPYNGVFDNLAMMILNDAGYVVNLESRPWVRAMGEARSGRADCILGVWYATERNDWLIFSPPLIENDMILIIGIKNRQHIHSLETLKDRRLGLVRGYAYPKEITDAGAKIEYEQDEETNLKKLIGNRIDVMLADRGVARYLINKLPPLERTQLEMQEPPIFHLRLHVGFAKNASRSVVLAADFTRAFSRLEKAGRITPLREDAARMGIKILRPSDAASPKKEPLSRN